MKVSKYIAIAGSLLLISGLFSCSKEDDPGGGGGGHHDWASDVVDFENVPEVLIGGPTAYGENLYYGYPDQITTGYVFGYESLIVQFPVNYGLTFDTEGNQVWGYSFFNGGVTVSNWHDMEDASYNNQLSVYCPDSPQEGNFLVATGVSKITDPNIGVYSDYDPCGHIYLSNKDGYTVKNPGEPGSAVSGEPPIHKESYFASVDVANTTYTYLTMKNGNAFAEPFDTDNKGWFKVQFIAFENDDPNGKPVGYVEKYLANFDYELTQESGLNRKIQDNWQRVDLSSLPLATILVINFVGSDMNEYGLNTPAYCALDNIAIVYW